MLVALYARVSTTRQAENELSIPDQLRQMRAWAEREGHIIVKEYVEPGASATDDKRPVFQEMMSDAALKPTPFQTVVVHSLSRFFRDMFMALLYQKTLRKSGIQLVSITQQTSDDSSGEMQRSMFLLFDEYQSKEIAKHTLRGMQENARQGYFNGSNAPFGYKTVEAGQTGTRGRIKKRLAINPAEAEIVRKIFALYVHGEDAPRIGMKEIASTLNQRGVSMRGKKWRIQAIQQILSSTTYSGWHVFNKVDSKTRQTKDEADWVKIPVPAIIEQALFDAASRLRAANTPKMCAPRRETSPSLLTGLLKCDCCGSSMIIATGKSGRYRYYKCTTRMSKGNSACPSGNVPADKLEALVLDAFRQKVCTPEHIQGIIKALHNALAKNGGGEKERVKKLEVELKDLELAQTRLLEMVEQGVLEREFVSDRARQHSTKKQALLLELAGLKRKQQMPLTIITPKRLESVTHVLRDRLTASTPYSRAYLKAILSEIRVKGQEITISGPNSSLVELISDGGNLKSGEVPRFIPEWRPLRPFNRHFRTIQSGSRIV